MVESIINENEVLLKLPETSVVDQVGVSIVYLQPEDAISVAYDILEKLQTEEQVMTEVQSRIDNRIEREHGIHHG
jgi:hypothetical protein